MHVDSYERHEHAFRSKVLVADSDRPGRLKSCTTSPERMRTSSATPGVATSCMSTQKNLCL